MKSLDILNHFSLDLLIDMEREIKDNLKKYEKHKELFLELKVIEKKLKIVINEREEISENDGMMKIQGFNN